MGFSNSRHGISFLFSVDWNARRQVGNVPLPQWYRKTASASVAASTEVITAAAAAAAAVAGLTIPDALSLITSSHVNNLHHRDPQRDTHKFMGMSNPSRLRRRSASPSQRSPTSKCRQSRSSSRVDKRTCWDKPEMAAESSRAENAATTRTKSSRDCRLLNRRTEY